MCDISGWCPQATQQRVVVLGDGFNYGPILELSPNNSVYQFPLRHSVCPGLQHFTWITSPRQVHCGPTVWIERLSPEGLNDSTKLEPGR